MATIAQLAEQLGASDQVQTYQAWRALLNLVAEAGRPGNEVGRGEAATSLAHELHATVEHRNDKGEVSHSIKHSAKVRGQICQLLADVASDAEVPALDRALADLDVREMARWALARVNSVASTAALAAAAEKAVGPEFKIGVVSSLAGRAGSEVPSAIGGCAIDQHLEVRVAAGEALATLGDASLDAGLVTLLEHSDGDARARARLFRARIRLAESLAKGGQKDAARKIYEAVAASGPEPQVHAAKLGLQNLG